ncbi:MAG: dihydrodipicolinate synthase family protein [Phycisphaeraceae bacterium]|nr:dihydrodipicolinate synthase family protein [Phycisphaeraceae bacterium]
MSQKAPKPFRGMMPILPTTITKDGRIDEASQRRLVQYAIKCGAAAIGHFGFASEFFKLNEANRKLVTQVVVDEAKGKVPVFIGVAAPATHMAVEYAKQAKDLGADLLMAAIPYIAVPDEKGTWEYYQRISDAVDLPIIVQDTPLSTNILKPDVVGNMFNQIEHIDYIKAEGSDFLLKSAKLIELSGGKLPVIGGAGGKHMIHMLRVGVTSFMTGTEALDVHAAVVKAYLDGDEDKAAEIYYQVLLPYFTFYDAYPEQLLKQMLYDRGIIDCPDIIHPRQYKPMSDVELKEFQWVLKRIGFDKKWPNIP